MQLHNYHFKQIIVYTEPCICNADEKAEAEHQSSHNPRVKQSNGHSLCQGLG